MIGKAIIGTSFNACINYCMDAKKRSEILAYNHVYGKTNNQLANQFNMIKNQRPGLKSPVWHSAISFAHEDKVNSTEMLKIAKDYLQEMGLDQQQFLIIKHNDTVHSHAHLIVNRVGMDGDVIRDWKSGYKTKLVMQKLEKKYGLVRAEERPNQRKVAIAQQIELGLANKEGLSNILSRIESLGYEVKYNKTSNGVVRGISFLDKEKGISFKSSQIHRNYSYTKLLAATQQKQFIRSKNISL